MKTILVAIFIMATAYTCQKEDTPLPPPSGYIVESSLFWDHEQQIGKVELNDLRYRDSAEVRAIDSYQRIIGTSKLQPYQGGQYFAIPMTGDQCARPCVLELWIGKERQEPLVYSTCKTK